MGDQVSERGGAVAQHERGGQILVGAIVDAHNAVGHRFRQNEPGENFCYGTEPKVGIAIGRLFAADHLRAEAEDLRSGICDKAYDEAGRLVERPSGGVHKTRSDSIEDHRYTLIGHHTIAVLLAELRSEAETGRRNFGQLTGLRIAQDSKLKGGKKEK